MTETSTVRDRIVSPLIWILAGGFLVSVLSSLTLLYQFVRPDRTQALTRWYCRTQLALTFNRQVHRVHPGVDPQTQYIFIQNHSSHLDHVAMYNATPHFKQGIELETHFDYPFYGWFMKARGTIPVPRDRSRALESLRDSIRAELDAGHSILGFPEGHRTETGRVGPFYDGLFQHRDRARRPGGAGGRHRPLRGAPQGVTGHSTRPRDHGLRRRAHRNPRPRRPRRRRSARSGSSCDFGTCGCTLGLNPALPKRWTLCHPLAPCPVLLGFLSSYRR